MLGGTDEPAKSRCGVWHNLELLVNLGVECKADIVKLDGLDYVSVHMDNAVI